MAVQHACPQCRAILPPGVSNCPQCGTSLEGLREIPVQKPGFEPPHTVSGSAPHAATGSMERANTQVTEIVAGRYHVIQPYPLQTCTFYQVVLEEDGARYLVRETLRPQGLSDSLLQHLRTIARQEIPHLLPHREILMVEGRSQVILRYPGSGWRSLSLLPAPLPLAEVLLWVRQAGAALQALSRKGLGSYPPGLAGREGFVLDSQNRLFLADLTLCRLLREDELADSRPLVSLLYYLATGTELTRAEVDEELVPEELRDFLKQWDEESKTIDDFMALLARIPVPDSSRRALRQLAGNATDTGRKRKSNEDWVATLTYSLDRTGHSIPLGLYIVADGMGGHAAGEHASSSGVRQPLLHFVEQQILPDLRNVTRRLSPETTAEEKLQAMVQLANERVYENRIQSGGDRGSTITTAMILGDECVVANVGDSRTYLYRDGQLQQLTEDHSLVARLVQAGEIKPEEIYTHIQRNQIYRSLGDQLEIPVDTFPLQLRAGDRLLLCSDGLWEMVHDPQIAQILAVEPNPQLACDHLVATANVNGGEDNISVIVIDIL